MNLTLSDKNYKYLFLLFIISITSILSVSTVTAVDIENQYNPIEAEVDSEVNANLTITNLYENREYNYWTLNANTELKNPEWVLRLYNLSGELINRELYQENNFNYTQISVEKNVSKIQLDVIGIAPKINNYSYQTPQEFTILQIHQKNQDTRDNEIAKLTTYYYTEQSRTTRNLLDTIKNNIDNKNNSAPSEAKDLYNNSVSSFNNGNIENSLDLARQAQQKIEDSETTQIFANTGILIGILIIIVIITYIIISNRKQDKLG